MFRSASVMKAAHNETKRGFSKAFKGFNFRPKNCVLKQGS